jgi:site-specific DNA-methyltransferase (adenine-specific)
MQKIKFDKRNYRKHNDKNKELIEKSLKECGAGRSIVIDNENEIIAGNGIYEQAKKLGIKTKVIETDGSELVVVKRTDLQTNDEKRKQLAVMDNSTSDSSEFDFELLNADFEVETLADWGIDANFELEEEKEIVEDEVPEEVETRAKLGDIWQLGNHRLMCGDSTSITDVEKLMNGEKADLLLTDPPYNVDYSAKNKFLNKYDNGNRVQKDIENDKKTSEEFYNFLYSVFSNAYNFIKDGACFYVFYPNAEFTNFHNALNSSLLKVHQYLVWCKNNHVLGMNDYQYKHEPIFYGWKDGKHNWYSDRSQTTVLNFNKPLKNDLHPTMKPIEILAYLLTNSTNKTNNKVLDLFGGSGSTLIACEQTNRKCLMIEYEPHYVDVIITRWENLTGQKAVLLNE